jgi:hypothetical protein
MVRHNAETRSAMYRLQKWYFDFLTPQNDFVFVYLACVRLAGMSLRSVAAHLARPDRGMARSHTIPISRCESRSDGAARFALCWPGGRIESQGGQWLLDFHTNSCSVKLEYRATSGANLTPVLIHTGARSRIVWQPLGLNYSVSGSVLVGGEQLDPQGARGYVDYLESTCLPWRVPVHSLCWGRLNHPELDLVYTHAAAGNGGRSWSGLSGRAGDLSFQCDQISLQLPPHHQSGLPTSEKDYALSAKGCSSRVHLRVSRKTALQAGGFIDQHDSLSRPARALLRLLARNPRSTKYLAQVDVDLEVADLHLQKRGLPMIDEFVLL